MTTRVLLLVGVLVAWRLPAAAQSHAPAPEKAPAAHAEAPGEQVDTAGPAGS